MFPRSSSFTPEQSRALTVLEDTLPLIKTISVPSVPPLEETTISDNRIFILQNVSTASLPRGDTWLWNQSRARKKVTDLTGNVFVSFYKLNTRSARHVSVDPPNYKMWVFNLNIQPHNKNLTFLWCERGQSRPSIDELQIEDFGFLAPFLGFAQAEEFGWV